MCCTEAIARILVFVSNFVFFLVGIALLALGILFKLNYTQVTDAIPEDYQSIQYVPILAIVLGAIIAVIAFLGCCGTLKSNTCMLTTYASIMIVIFLLQVGLGIYGLVIIKNKDDLASKVNTQLTNFFSGYNDKKGVKDVVDFIQDQFQCCGTDDGRQYWIQRGMTVPDSCKSYTKGCSTLVSDFIHESINIIGVVAIVISLVEIAGAILALCLSNCIKSK